MVNVNTELRKLRPAELYNLGLILDPSDNWKRLMASVTKDGTDDVPKFPGEYISIVEHAARQERKLAAAIFLEEWATMGKKRPTVGLLLDLLMKNELFRAADYVAQNIMKVAAPQRPTSGPAAAIDIDAIADLLLRQNLESGSNNKDFRQRSTGEIRLSQVDYPMGVFNGSGGDNDNDDATNDDNLHYDVGDVGVIEMQYAESRSNQVLEAARIPGNFSREKIASSAAKSDLMKFSEENDENSRNQSDLLKFDSAENPDEKIVLYEAVMPNLSILGVNSSSVNDMKINSRLNRDSAANVSLAPAINVEMTSAELPACLGGFGESSSIETIAEPDNSYFNRELMSAELPLCINDRLTANSSNSVETTESIESEEDDDVDDAETTTEIPNFVVEAGRRSEEKNERLPEPGNNLLTSQELPITVLEFHHR